MSRNASFSRLVSTTVTWVIALAVAAGTPRAAEAQDEGARSPSLLAAAQNVVARVTIDRPVDDCAHRLAAATSRRTHGRTMTTVGVVGAVYGYVLFGSTIGGACAPGRCSSTDRNVGLGGLVGGLTLAGFGFDQAHRADLDVRGLVAQDACVETRAASLEARAPRMAVMPPMSSWARVVADAKARRSTGHKTLAVGLLALVAGQQLVLHSTGDNGPALLGAAVSMVGLTAAIRGHLAARDASRELDALTARLPASTDHVDASLAPRVTVGPHTGGLTWRIAW